MEKGLILKWLTSNSCDPDVCFVNEYYDGYGDGFGSGNGSWCGECYAGGESFGDGYADGSGDSIGFGSDYANGSGDIHGSGYGAGLGLGCGNVYGNCYCNSSSVGYGVDLIKLHGYDIFYLDNVPTIIVNIKNNYAKGFMVGGDYQLIPCYIAKDEYTNLFAHGETLKEAVSSLREKVYEDMSEEERLKAFTDNFKLNKAYKGTEYFKWHNILTGSCLIGREQFVKDNGLDLNAKYTVLEFIKIVENAYGGQIIKELKKYYANTKSDGGRCQIGSR